MSKKLLTVDDSKTVRLIVKKHVSVFGVEILEAENGEVGVKVAKEGKPDLILLDYNMPVMDGEHTLAALKADPDTKDIPVIMLTTETVQETVIKLIKLGLKDFIAKPFTRELLLKKINTVLPIYTGDEPPAAAEPGSEAAAPPAGKRSVLAVDDKENILNQIKDFLGDAYYVLTAATGGAADAAMKNNQIDYLLLDLSMPDTNWTDVYKSFSATKNDDASVPKKVAVMTLPTAHNDIAQAAGMGLNTILYKPLVKEDTLEVMNILSSNGAKQTSFMETNGDVRVLTCPSAKSPKFRGFMTSINSIITKEVESMAEDGLTKLIISLGDGALADLASAGKLIDLIEHADQLSLKVRLVAESDQTREAIKQLAEIAKIPTDMSLDTALKALA